MQPDPAEPDLSLSTRKTAQVAEKLDKVKCLRGFAREVVGGDAAPPKMELWWLFLIGVTLLLCGEVDDAGSRWSIFGSLSRWGEVSEEPAPHSGPSPAGEENIRPSPQRGEGRKKAGDTP